MDQPASCSGMAASHSDWWEGNDTKPGPFDVDELKTKVEGKVSEGRRLKPTGRTREPVEMCEKKIGLHPFLTRTQLHLVPKETHPVTSLLFSWLNPDTSH